ncbi:hypothetical protein KR093_000948 [Drosophila rubida]|uniref:Uncharacterized protein n=1 Tax=Drosophila rubida TaxID=30044 RepID=A0AAD4JY38_9MUSC|nr:hypothetical protein KR093_000948 [Drosophila rubida]
MSLCFETALDMVVAQLKIPIKEHKAFLKDVELLSNFINQALADRKSIFAGSFTNLPETATYMCGNVIDVPDRFNCYLLLDLSYAHQVELDGDDYVYLHSDCRSRDVRSRISSVFLQKTLRDDLYDMLGRQPLVKCKARTYKLCFHTSIYPISAHTIIASQLDSKNNARIVFEFLLAIKFPLAKVPRPASMPMPESMPLQTMAYWLAMPVTHFDVHFNAQNYLGRVHVWQVATSDQRQRWRLAVRLSYMLSIINETLCTIGIHALKHTCINLCERYGLDKADKPLSHKLVDMMNTHGSHKLTEVSTAHNSGYLVNFEAHPALSADCFKTDVMLSKMQAKMKKANAVNMDKFKVLLELLRQNTPRKGKKQK